MKADKVYLVGFMGSGKTTVARALARRLDWQAVDIDELIERAGAPDRRRALRPARRAVLSRRRTSRARSSSCRRGTSVVATGGGTFVDPQNRAIINSDGLSVWLDVPLERLIARVPADGRRPLAADRAEFERLYAAPRRVPTQTRTSASTLAAPASHALVEQLVRLARA